MREQMMHKELTDEELLSHLDRYIVVMGENEKSYSVSNVQKHCLIDIYSASRLVELGIENELLERDKKDSSRHMRGYIKILPQIASQYL